MTAAAVLAESMIQADVRMISGCEDVQTSADVTNVANFKLPDPAGLGGGACTSALLQALYNDHQDTNADLSFEQVLLKIRENMRQMGLSQIPQLSSSREMDMKQLFHIVPQGSNGVRRAVLIGINYTGQEGELSGCQNDVKNMMEYLQQVHGFQKENITLMLDDKKNTKPTRKNITDAFKNLAKVSEPGDVVFIHFSGHGGKIRDFDGDEDDGFDETLVPVDFERCGQIRDDYLYQKLVCPMKAGVTMTCLFDCCHSGTVLDLPYVFKGDGNQESMTTPDGFDATKIEQAAHAPDIESDDDKTAEEAWDNDNENDGEEWVEADVGENMDEEELGEVVEDVFDDDDYEGDVASDAALKIEPSVSPPPPILLTTEHESFSPVYEDGPPEPEIEPSGEMQEVYVRYDRESITIRADIDEKFLVVKKKLEEKTGVPVNEQNIVYNGLGFKLKDDKSLRYYGCTGGVFLTMSQKKK